MNAVAVVLEAARREGVELAWRHGQLMARPAPLPALATLIARHRLRLAAHLTGSVCRACGEPCHPDFNPHPGCQQEGPA